MNRFTLIAVAFAAAASASPALSQNINEAFAAAIVEFPAVTRSKGSLRTTGTAIAPGLAAAGVNSCAGSTTGAVAGSGFGLSFGSTHAMDGCERRANAVLLAGLGHKGAALALLCDDPKTMAALNLSGVLCPQQAAARTAAAPARTARARSATPWRD